jgi:hypothetical protein
MERFQKKLTKALIPILERSYSQSNFEWALTEIKGVGRDLYQDVLSNELRSFMKDMPCGATIDVSTTKNVWIPWEIIFDETDFWGMNFHIRRVPRIPYSRGDSVGRKRPVGILAGHKVKTVLNIIGDKIGKEEKAALRTFERLREPYGLNVICLRRESTTSLKSKLREADVTHFTCHGPLSNNEQYLRMGPNQEDRLTIAQIQGLEEVRGLVFANACCSAAPISSFVGFTNFAWEFYQKGAEVYIGTLAPVPTRYAITFADKFYELWLSQNDHSCGKALRSAKLNMKENMIKSGKTFNPFWLFYCQYGKESHQNPHDRQQHNRRWE